MKTPNLRISVFQSAAAFALLFAVANAYCAHEV